jgi:hypothetical protein
MMLRTARKTLGVTVACVTQVQHGDHEGLHVLNENIFGPSSSGERVRGPAVAYRRALELARTGVGA